MFIYMYIVYNIFIIRIYIFKGPYYYTMRIPNPLNNVTSYILPKMSEFLIILFTIFIFVFNIYYII